MLLLAGWYIARREIGGVLARRLDERLSAAGVFLEWQSAAWEPASGIQVSGLALYRDAAKSERLAHLDHVTLIKSDPEWSHWDNVSVRLRNARLTLGSGDGETSLEHMNMRLDIQHGKADLLECLADLQGLRIDAKGTYVQAAAESQVEDGGTKDTKPQAKGDGAHVAAPRNKGLFDNVDLSWLNRLKEWTKVAGENEVPVLKFELRPGPDGSGLDLAATLEARRFKWRGQRWDLLRASVRTSLKKEISPIEICPLRLEHAGRSAEVAGVFDPASRVLRIDRLESGLDVLMLVQAFLPRAAEALAAVTCQGEWDVSGKGDIALDRPAESRWDGQAKLDGSVVCASGGKRMELQDPVCVLRGDEFELSAKTLRAGQGKGNRLSLAGDARLIKGHSKWNQWDQMLVSVRDAQLTLGSDDAEASLEDLIMELEIHPGRFDLQKCLAKLHGWKVEVKGTYVQTASATPLKDGGAKAPASQSKKDNAKATESQNKGLLDDLDLSWMKSLKAWATVAAEKDDPVLKVEFSPLPDNGGLDVAATLEGKKFKWRGERWDLLQASVKTSLKKGKAPIEICQLRLEREGRNGEATGVFDRASNLLRIDKLESGIDFPRLMRAIVPAAAAGLDSVTSKGRWDVSGKGDILFDRPAKSRWNGQVKLDGELAYAIGKGQMPLQNPTCAVRGEGLKVSIQALKAGLWEGTLDVPLTQIYPPAGKSKARFETQITLTDARLESVMNSFGKAEKQPGVGQATWQGGGGFGVAAFTGSGTVNIEDAEFFRLPILGTFSLLLDKLTPGFGRDQSSRVEAAYRTSGGKLQIEELTLTSHQMRLEAGGWIDLKRHYVNVTAEARLKGIVGLVSAIAGKVEAAGQGPLGSVVWKRRED